MSLGIAVHNVVESLKNYKVSERLDILNNKNLLLDFDNEFEKVKGKKGGFVSVEQEREFKSRGIKMIENVISDPKMLLNKTIALSSYYKGDMLPNFFISEKENIILCGNVDWIEYNEISEKEGQEGEKKHDSISVIDFKTGRNEEKENSIQLPIYKILLEELQNKWKVKNGKYWYFENGEVVIKEIDQNSIEEVKENIIKIGIEIRDKKFAWSSNARFGKAGWVERDNYADNFKCINGDEGCYSCRDYELVYNFIQNNKQENKLELDSLLGESLELSGKVNLKEKLELNDSNTEVKKEMRPDLSVEYLGVDMYNKDLYFINK